MDPCPDCVTGMTEFIGNSSKKIPSYFHCSTNMEIFTLDGFSLPFNGNWTPDAWQSRSNESIDSNDHIYFISIRILREYILVTATICTRRSSRLLLCIWNVRMYNIQIYVSNKYYIIQTFSIRGFISSLKLYNLQRATNQPFW